MKKWNGRFGAKGHVSRIGDYFREGKFPREVDRRGSFPAGKLIEIAYREVLYGCLLSRSLLLINTRTRKEENFSTTHKVEIRCDTRFTKLATRSTPEPPGLESWNGWQLWFCETPRVQCLKPLFLTISWKPEDLVLSNNISSFTNCLVVSTLHIQWSYLCSYWRFILTETSPPIMKLHFLAAASLLCIGMAEEVSM